MRQNPHKRVFVEVQPHNPTISVNLAVLHKVTVVVKIMKTIVFMLR